MTSSGGKVSVPVMDPIEGRVVVQDVLASENSCRICCLPVELLLARTPGVVEVLLLDVFPALSFRYSAPPTCAARRSVWFEGHC